MCTIDKLLIKGIRSFSPDNQHVIEFYKPLTLIVGQNGAGKTTVVECLKQACTGELPPNCNKGQSFIHDPKVAGESEVKAQIKLRFRTATNQPVVIIRSFQLTQKNKTQSFKALDQTLCTQSRETGEKEAMSYKCLEMDRAVPTLMGVSKAILENVIFVHQEESNWPLAEGQTLKKKFDDIFSATKYTKALEALRKLRTEKVAEVKEFKLRLAHLATHRDTAARLRREVDNGQARIDELSRQISAIELEAAALTQAIDAVDAQLLIIADYDDQVKSLRIRYEFTTKANKEAYARLAAAYGEEDLTVPLEQLQSWAADLEPQAKAARSKLTTVEIELQTVRMGVTAEREQYERALQKQSRATAAAEAHARHCADRDRYVRDLAARSGVGAQGLPPAGPLSPAHVGTFVAALVEHEAGMGRELARLKAANAKRDDEMGALVDAVTSKLAGAKEAVRAKQDLVRSAEATMQRLQSEVGGCAVSRAQLEEVKDRERMAEAQMRSRQAALEAASASGELKALPVAMAEVQARVSALRQERERVAAVADSGSKLRLRRQDMAAKEAALDTLLAGSRTRLEALLGRRGRGLPASEQLKAAADAAITTKQQDAESKAATRRQLEAKHLEAQALLASSCAQLQGSCQELARLRQQLQQGLAAIYSQGIPEDLIGQKVAEEEEKFAVAHTGVARLDSFEINVQHWKRIAERDHRCGTCERPLSRAELQAFLKKQEETLAQAPALKLKTEAEMRRVQQRISALRDLQPTSARAQALAQREIPALQQKVADQEAAEAAAAERLEVAHAEAAEAQHALQEGQKLVSDVVWQVDRLARELAAAQQEVQQLSAQSQAMGSGRSVSDVDADLEAVETERMQLEQRKEAANRKQERLRNELASVTHEYHMVKDEAMRKVAKAERRSQLDTQIKELEAQVAAAISVVEQLNRQMQPLEAERAERAREREQARAASRAKEAQEEARLREVGSGASELRAKQRPVEEYQASGSAERLQEAGMKLEASRTRMASHEQKVKELGEELAKLQADARDSDANKRQLEACIAYQRSLREEKDLRAQIDEARRKLGDVGDHPKLIEELNRLHSKHNGLRAKQDMAKGSLGTVREGVKRAQVDLSANEYRGIDGRHRKQQIEMRTTEMAASDLDKYHKALEKALLTFHTSKMSDINKIVKELWQKTYRNQDIDYIQIKADADHGAQRSYNYRVVMFAGGTELDMRGRCSAGQKVLACLIIRLALAETFCLNCGILALDEPTTNLDEANAGSLAEALRQIMAQRAQQANFQIVVITHDERFAHMIGTREHAEYLWRITKDQNQHSHIAQEPLLD